MCFRRETCFGVDIDLLFSYETPKVVLVQHRLLGFLYYSFTLSIVFYVLIYAMLLEKGYLEYDTVTGTQRQVLLHFDHPANLSSLSYCTGEIPCVVWDTTDVRYPNADTQSMMVTTYLLKKICQRDRPRTHLSR